MPYIGKRRENRQIGGEFYVTQGKMPCFFGASIPAFGEIELRQLEGALHGAGGEDLRAVVEVRVNVGGGADVAVPQPLLDLLHGDAVFEQKGCAAVAQVVQADVPQTLLPQELSEAVGDILLVLLIFLIRYLLHGDLPSSSQTETYHPETAHLSALPHPDHSDQDDDY